jgi:F-box/leucine-rich repeat protein 10/11
MLMQSAADAIRLSIPAYGSPHSRSTQVMVPSVKLDARDFERMSSPNEPDVKAERQSPILQHSSTQLSNGSLVSPPDSTSNGLEFPSMANESMQTATSPNSGSATSPDLGEHVITPSSASRHSSRQPKNVDRYVPDSFVAKVNIGRRSEDVQDQMQGRRASSSAASTLTAVTDASRRLSSNTSGPVDAFTAPTSTIEVKTTALRAGSTDSVAVIDDADERLARELHAQWNGSVRRSTRP